MVRVGFFVLAGDSQCLPPITTTGERVFRFAGPILVARATSVVICGWMVGTTTWVFAIAFNLAFLVEIIAS